MRRVFIPDPPLKKPEPVLVPVPRIRTNLNFCFKRLWRDERADGEHRAILLDGDAGFMVHDPLELRLYFRVFCPGCPRGAQVTRTYICEKEIAVAFSAADLVQLVTKKIEEAVVAFRVAHPPPKDAALRITRGL